MKFPDHRGKATCGERLVPLEEFEERALEASEALRETLEELEKSLSEPEQPEALDP